MIVQTIRGIAFFSQIGPAEAVQKVRWTVMFALIFLVFVKSTSAKIKSVFDKDLAYKLTIAGLVFNAIYLVFGLVSIYLTGSTSFTQFAMITDEYRVGTSPLLAMFGSTGYVVCVYYIIIPATLITIKNYNRRRANLAWFVLAFALTVQMLYNSRSGMLAIVVFTSLFVLQNLQSRRVMKGLMVFIPLVGFAVLFQVFFNQIDPSIIFEDLLNTLGIGNPARYNPDLQDIDRRIWNYSAILALSDNTFNLLFGWGTRTSGYIVAPYVYDLFLEAHGQAVFREDVATPGFAALAVDTGLIGLLLIFSLLMSCLVGIYRLHRKVDFVVLLIPTAFVLQLFIMNIFDVILLYLVLMPSGLALALAKSKFLHASGWKLERGRPRDVPG
ncbi:MAG: hypothetical protein IH951_10570 [Bacteroidetes bacterium]|nr:hypothetical protein [Bacteroidota bacterium]